MKKGPSVPCLARLLMHRSQPQASEATSTLARNLANTPEAETTVLQKTRRKRAIGHYESCRQAWATFEDTS